MQVRMLVLAGLAGACGWVARGIVAVPEATAQPQRSQIVVTAPPAIQVVMAPPDQPPPAEVTEGTEDEIVEDEPADGAGEDLGAVIARAQQQVAEHNSIYGKVTDQRTGEGLAGVTVVVAAPPPTGSQVSITDEQGCYKISNLPTGYVLVTFYYGEHTVERDNVMISSLDPTPVYQRIDQTPSRPPPPDDFIITNLPSEGIVIDVESTKHIPVPGRTFESALGAAAGEQNDGLGVSFSGGCTIENTYVIE